ncbi:MAG: rhodanese-like domain-containing protein [Planctomycetota bacterium]|nr:MAG: rhodanese-like domain-containing protein [Planctomycetota bacterium]
MTTTTSPIDLNMTMEQILARYPSAQRALFQRYHVGGCSSCGFEPDDTLAQVCKDHNLLDTTSVVQTILAAHEVDQKMQIEPKQVKAWLDAGEPFRFVDVRTPEELAIAKIPQAEALDYQAPEKYMQLPKDTKIVFSCKSGMRSMDVASYFIGHGFTNVYSMRGGINGWRQQIDPSIPAY